MSTPENSAGSEQDRAGVAAESKFLGEVVITVLDPRRSVITVWVMGNANTTHTSHRVPALVTLAFECGNGAAACDTLWMYVDAGLASDSCEIVAWVRGIVVRTCNWLADSGVAYTAADEECLTEWIAQLDERESAIKLRAHRVREFWAQAMPEAA